MSSPLDTMVLKRDRDLVGREHEIWARRILMTLICAVPVVALFNVFGQRPQTTRVDVPTAALSLNAPTHLRSGLLFTAKFNITAHREIKKATLVLDPGWADGMQVNTIEPSPVGEASANGRLSLSLGHIRAGQTFRLFMAFQVNATTVGRRSQDVEVLDGTQPLIHLDRTLTIFP